MRLASILLKLMPKKLMGKIVGRQFNKAKKIDCGIFAQAAKKAQETRQAPLKALIEEASLGHHELPEDLLKFIRTPKKGVTTLTPYKGGSKTTSQLMRDKLHQNIEVGTSIKKDLLG